MLMASGCRRIISQARLSSLTDQVCTQMAAVHAPVRVDDLSDLSPCFPLSAGGTVTSDMEVMPYPLPDSASDANVPVVYFHSSGSTGLPKTVPYNTQSMWQYLLQGKLTVISMSVRTYTMVRFISRVAQKAYSLCCARHTYISSAWIHYHGLWAHSVNPTCGSLCTALSRPACRDGAK
jgi:acyl-CoA synthetase (AMP-forming)/AMP-acid ligase II